MQAADQETITHLNAVLKNRLTAINQYFLHARMLKHQGDVKLADYEYKASIDAMKHADMLVEHVLSLGGVPNLQDLGSLMIGEKAADMLAGDLALTETAFMRIKAAIALCESRKNHATTGMLAKILASQQEHADFIRTQITTTNIKDCA